MSQQTPVIKPIYSLLPTEVDGFDSLAELALDMRWSDTLRRHHQYVGLEGALLSQHTHRDFRYHMGAPAVK